MSWFARSLVNSLRGEENEDDDSSQSKSNEENSNRSSLDRENERQGEDEDEDPTRGVEEDLSELTKTLTRQFWGVASFLAPPPTAGDPPPADPGQRLDPAAEDDGELAGSPRLAGIRSDFAEIAGRFRSGISMLSNTKAVAEISKIGSTFLPFGSDKDEERERKETGEKSEGGAAGVTDEVIAFARNISMHPETWLDFPLIPDEDDSDEFDMSDAQQEHALAVERLAPRLAALRIELCPSHMSEGHFWKIYFVLLHSRLNWPDAELLTTPQIVQARAMLLQDLQNRAKPKSDGSGSGIGVTTLPTEVDASNATVPVEQNVISPSETFPETSPCKTHTAEDPSTSVSITDLETEKHPVETTEVKIIDKTVIEEDPPVQAMSKDISSDASKTVSVQKYEDDGDDWLEEEETGEAGVSAGATIPLGNDEDVSFSDLEDDDDQEALKNSKRINHGKDSQTKDSKEGWIQLKNSESAAKGGNSTSRQNKESSDWLSIDDIDE